MTVKIPRRCEGIFRLLLFGSRGISSGNLSLKRPRKDIGKSMRRMRDFVSV